MAKSDTYMFDRGKGESRRLDFQNEFFRHLTHGSLLHPCIPLDDVSAVADVGSGTGAWIQDVALSLRGAPEATHQCRKKQNFVGFDISPNQFPAADTHLDGLNFVVHDITARFPEEYHGKFDVVHIRFLSYALKERDLTVALQNVTEILRPGGYLQWQEVDIIDVWATPSTETVRKAITMIVLEKMERGLTLSMPTQIIRAMLSLSHPSMLEVGKVPATNPSTKFNPVSWTNDLLRVIVVEPVSTYEHPAPEVQAHKDAVGLAVNTTLLRAGAVRRRALGAEERTSPDTRRRLIEDAEQAEELAKAIERELEEKVNQWHAIMTWIVARKAIVLGEDEDWMTVIHPTPKSST